MSRQTANDSARPIAARTLILAVFVAFVVGFVCGVGYSVLRSTPGHEHRPASPPHRATGAGGSLADLEAAAQAEPDNAQLWVRLGDAFSDSGRADDAIAAYTRALAITPENNNARTDLGVAYFHNNMPEEAVAEFDKVLADDPKHPQARFNRGVVLYSGLGDRAGALAEWRRLLELHPETRTPSGQPLGELIRELESSAQTAPQDKTPKAPAADDKTPAETPPAPASEAKPPAETPPAPASEAKPPAETPPASASEAKPPTEKPPAPTTEDKIPADRPRPPEAAADVLPNS